MAGACNRHIGNLLHDVRCSGWEAYVNSPDEWSSKEIQDAEAYVRKRGTYEQWVIGGLNLLLTLLGVGFFVAWRFLEPTLHAGDVT